MSGKNEEEQREKIKKIEAYFHFDCVISPYSLGEELNENYKKLGKEPSYNDYLLNDLNKLCICNAIFMCKGWEYSKGCRVEYALANALEIEILHEREFLY
jgi:hypothetical protein